MSPNTQDIACRRVKKPSGISSHGIQMQETHLHSLRSFGMLVSTEPLSRTHCFFPVDDRCFLHNVLRRRFSGGCVTPTLSEASRSSLRAMAIPLARVDALSPCRPRLLFPVTSKFTLGLMYWRTLAK